MQYFFNNTQLVLQDVLFFVLKYLTDLNLIKLIYIFAYVISILIQSVFSLHLKQFHIHWNTIKMNSVEKSKQPSQHMKNKPNDMFYFFITISVTQRF